MEIIDANPRSVPDTKPLLGKNSDGKDIEGDEFHFRSATGLLQYLDSECLLGTSDEGLACAPNEYKDLEVFADSDVTGGFNKTNSVDLASACFQEGLIIKCAGCQIT